MTLNVLAPANHSKITSSIYTLSNALVIAPALSSIYIEALKSIENEFGDAIPRVISLDVSATELAGLLKGSGKKSRVLVLYANADFESEIPALMSKEGIGTPLIVSSIDKTRFIPVMAFSLGDRAIFVPECGYVDALNACTSESADKANCGTLNVIIVTGRTVVVCGLRIDEDDLSYFQASSMSAQSCRAEDVYSEQELNDAAKVAAQLGTDYWYFNHVKREYEIDIGLYERYVMAYCLKKN